MNEKEDILLTGISDGMIGVVLARMDTHPEEFWSNCDKWRFIYKDYFRDAMTETEKGMIFDKMKKIRREEFNQAVLDTLVPPSEEEQEERSAFGSAPMKRDGSKVAYDAKKRKGLGL